MTSWSIAAPRPASSSSPTARSTREPFARAAPLAAADGPLGAAARAAGLHAGTAGARLAAGAQPDHGADPRDHVASAHLEENVAAAAIRLSPEEARRSPAEAEPSWRRARAGGAGAPRTACPAALEILTMEYRHLGRSGLRVSALTLGTMTFGGAGFAKAGDTDVAGARRQVDRCLDAGVNLIDTADVYSGGALGGDPRRGRCAAGATGVLIATKARMRDGRRAERRRAVAPPPDRAPARPACAAWAPTRSTSTRCTSGTARPRSRRRSSALDTLVRAAARSATSAARTTRAGT